MKKRILVGMLIAGLMVSSVALFVGKHGVFAGGTTPQGAAVPPGTQATVSQGKVSDVKIDAGSGTVLTVEVSDALEESGTEAKGEEASKTPDTDAVQEEVQSENDTDAVQEEVQSEN